MYSTYCVFKFCSSFLSLLIQPTHTDVRYPPERIQGRIPATKAKNAMSSMRNSLINFFQFAAVLALSRLRLDWIAAV